MLGEKIGESTGKVTGQRVLGAADGKPKMETTFQAKGRLCGVDISETGTYWAILRSDGTLYGEGQGVLMGGGGEMGTWVGQGVGRIGQGGAVSYRGAIYVRSAHPKWSPLNGIAVVYEYDVDAQGSTTGKLYEWK